MSATESKTADYFLEARSHRPKWFGVPEEFRPRSIEEGYRIQQIVYERIEAACTRRAGYKVGAVARSGQQHFGIDEPAYGGIFESSRMGSLADILNAGLVEPSIECEIAVVLAGDLIESGKMLQLEDIASTVATCHIACEIIDNRYGDPLALGVPSLVVDDFFNAGFVLGPACAQWRNLDLSNLRGETRIDGFVVTGNSADALHALTCVQWLSHKLAAVGSALRKGDIILTGAVVNPTKLPASTRALSLRLEGFDELDIGAGHLTND